MVYLLFLNKYIKSLLPYVKFLRRRKQIKTNLSKLLFYASGEDPLSRD